MSQLLIAFILFISGYALGQMPNKENKVQYTKYQLIELTTQCLELEKYYE